MIVHDKMVCINDFLWNSFLYKANTIYTYKPCIYTPIGISHYSILNEDCKFFIGYLTPDILCNNFIKYGAWLTELASVDIMYELLLL